MQRQLQDINLALSLSSKQKSQWIKEYKGELKKGHKKPMEGDSEHRYNRQINELKKEMEGYDLIELRKQALEIDAYTSSRKAS